MSDVNVYGTHALARSVWSAPLAHTAVAGRRRAYLLGVVLAPTSAQMTGGVRPETAHIDQPKSDTPGPRTWSPPV